MLQKGYQLLRRVVRGGGGGRLTYAGGGKRVKKQERSRCVVGACTVSCLGVLLLLLCGMARLTHRIRPHREDASPPLPAGGGGGSHNGTARAARQQAAEEEAVLRMMQAKGMLLRQHSLYRLEGIKDPRGKGTYMGHYNGMISIIVNVACHTPDADPLWAPLFALQKKYQSQGVIVLAFPIEDFLTGPSKMSDYELQRYIHNKFGTENGKNGDREGGDDAAPPLNIKVFAVTSLRENKIYTLLHDEEEQLPHETVDSNFNMYLIDRTGFGYHLYKPGVPPWNPTTFTDDITHGIEQLLIEYPVNPPDHVFDKKLTQPFPSF